MVRRYELWDDLRDRIKDLLPGREETMGVTAKDNRLFVEAVHTRVIRWCASGMWEAVFRQLATEADNE